MTPRRAFLKTTTLTSLAAASSSAHAQQTDNQTKIKNPADRLRIGVMGLGRGKAHVKNYLEIPGAEVAYVCDVDSRVLQSMAKHVADRQDTKPVAVSDFRKILDDPTVDALSIAAPNYWHAPATILACQAGKHVYVEKPGSHNPYEARRMVEVAQEEKRVVQMGNQRRSLPSGIIEGIAQGEGRQ